ncbi:hypothetical protein Tcan_18142 [Toxocara canis]|uniref:Uncharacterized protein n=1 Tax=Toxocara canis TaxID=6265 RepID=A0A0B2VJW0_TOXCA|nr:hypothetical protein Tcan_18142 [Toxocara canis]
MAKVMDSETYVKLRGDIRADLREEIMAEVRQQRIPMVRALVQEVMDNVKTTMATTRIDQGTQFALVDSCCCHCRFGGSNTNRPRHSVFECSSTGRGEGSSRRTICRSR